MTDRWTEHDPSYDEWLAKLAAECRSCPDCWDVPCGGCQGGGICDDYCRCDREDEVDDD